MTNNEARELKAFDKVRIKGSRKVYEVLGPPQAYLKSVGGKKMELVLQLVDEERQGTEVLPCQIERVV